MSWLDVIGWCGSALPVFSLLQAHGLRLRVLNLLARDVLEVGQDDEYRPDPATGGWTLTL